MNKGAFWIFGHLGLGDHIVCLGLYRHFAKLHETVIIPVWEHNLASLQWLLKDCGNNIFFYPLESESQLLACKDSIKKEDKLCLGFYEEKSSYTKEDILYGSAFKNIENFNPVKWDSEFYRQAALDFDLSYSGFRLPEFDKDHKENEKIIVMVDGTKCEDFFIHQDIERGFVIRKEFIPKCYVSADKNKGLSKTCTDLWRATEIHCIDSSMLCLADRLETPHCKRFVFHRYARKGLPPGLKKNWEIIE